MFVFAPIFYKAVIMIEMMEEKEIISENQNQHVWVRTLLKIAEKQRTMLKQTEHANPVN